jgi:hypothetical protein
MRILVPLGMRSAVSLFIDMEDECDKTVWVESLLSSSERVTTLYYYGGSL